MMMKALLRFLQANVIMFHVTLATSSTHDPCTAQIAVASATSKVPALLPREICAIEKRESVYSVLAHTSKSGTPSVPRGGALSSSSWLKKVFGSNRKSALKIYQQSLQEQIRKLEQQLRTSKEEAAHLRKSLERLGVEHRKNLSTNVQLKKDQAVARDVERLQKELSLMEAKVKSLEEIKSKLEESLKEQTEKTEILQGKLNLAIKNESSLRSKYEQDMEALERRLLAESRRQLEALEKRLEEQAQEAQAKLALLKKKHEAQLEQVRKETIRSTTKKLEAAHAKELSTLQTKSDAAVEREKVKMRKLVKALAEREKKLFAAAQAKPNQTSSTSTTGQRNVLSSSSNRKSPTNVRTVK